MAMLPKKTQGDSGLQAGALVVYENDGRPIVAAVLAFKNQKYQVLNHRGREVELPSFRLHGLPGRLPAEAATTEAKTEYLESLADLSGKAAAELNLGDLWAFVQGEPREYGTRELVELYYGKDTLQQHLTLHLALLTDRIFFKRKDASFIPRPSEVVEELKRSEQSRLERQRVQELTVSTFQKRHKGDRSPLPREIEGVVHLIEQVAAGVRELDNAKLKDARDIIDLCAEKLGLTLEGNRETRALELLESVGLAGPNTNFAFVRHQYPLRYSAAVLAEAEALVIPKSLAEFPEEDRAKRKDLTALETFTVDDISTRDMDDALSIERTRDGFRLGVHITDVASVISHDSLLERDARSRATSLYAPERTANMFPPVLAEDKLSLRAGEPRPALSCLIEIDRNFDILSSEVTLSLISVSRRLSYNDVDAALEDPHSEFNTLYNIAAALEAHRISAGAAKVSKREIQIVLKDDGDFDLVEIDESSPARSLIGEMMVLANTIFADFAVRHGIPLVFRGQDAPDPEGSQDVRPVPDGPAADYRARSRMKKSFTSVTPVRHSSLALNAYAQVTSPIRRYADLVNQRQLVEFIVHGRPAYSGEQCLKLMEEIESPLSLAQAISKETRRFWLLRALQKLSESVSVFHGTVLRTDLKNPLVELHELVMPVLVKMHAPVQPGDEIKIRVLKVDPLTDYLRLEQIASN